MKRSLYSEDDLKTKLIYEDAERYRRAIVASFTGVTILIMLAWFLLQSPTLNLTISVKPLSHLTGSAFVISLFALLLALFSRTLQPVMSILSLFIALLFFPTLMYTGGFISPFTIVYLLAMLLSIILVDLVSKWIGFLDFFIITSSYNIVSLAQKSGVMPVHIEYVKQLMDQEYFFWLVFITVNICFIHGFIVVYNSSKNIRGTLAQMILTYRHVAEGTTVFTGKLFSNDICEALRKSLNVSSTFLIEIDKDEKFKSLVSVAGFSGTEQYERALPEEFLYTLTKSMTDLKIMKIADLHGFPVEVKNDNNYVYWMKINNESGALCAILGIIDVSINKVKRALAADILQIFANRISSEFARSAEERKRLQMQQLFSQGQKMQAIGKLASVIAHDFNNILNGIFGFASLIKKTAGPDSVQTKYAEKIFQLGNNATALIAHLLSYSRAKPINFVSFDITSIVDGCLEIVRLTLKKPIKILNVCQQKMQVFGDASMVQAALLNLVLNACDAIENQGELNVMVEKKQMGESDVQDFITGKFIPSGEYTVVSVCDTGCGIPEDQLIRIFEPFYTTKTTGRGTGLGLATVVGCMEAHKGFITVNSVPGTGSTFHLYFSEVTMQKEAEMNSIDVIGDKLYQVDRVSQEFQTSVTSSVNNQSVMKNCQNRHDIKEVIASFDELSDYRKNLLRRKIKKVLIADDDIMILDSVSTFLNGLGYNIISCNSGENAIKMFVTNRDSIDIAILDMILPDITGKVLLDRFREIKTDIRVVIMTGFSNSEDIKYVKQKGVITILNKPFEFSMMDNILLGIASNMQEKIAD